MRLMIYCTGWSNLMPGNTTCVGQLIWRNQTVTDMNDSGLLASFHSE